MAGRTFQILPSALPVKCPMCGVEISWRYVYGTFNCPACGCGLKLRPRYFRALYAVGLVIAFGVAYAMGLRDRAQQAAVAFLVLPILILIQMINLRLFPPEVEISGDVRGILHSAEPQDPSIPPDPFVIAAVPADDAQRVAPRVFNRPSMPRSMEGWVIAAGFAAVFAYAAYEVAEPFIYRVWPEYRATKHGPRGFPITLQIESDALRVTNGSSEQWHCYLALGSRGPYRASVAISPSTTADVPFSSFRTSKGRPETRPQETLRSAARQMIYVECLEPGGQRQHSFTFD